MATEEKNKDKKVNFSLSVSSKKGFAIAISRQGRKLKTIKIPLKSGALDYDELHAKALNLKQKHPIKSLHAPLHSCASGVLTA